MLNNLPVVILCGGRGMRLEHYTDSKPKPMVTIGDEPILAHIMKFFLSYGCQEFYLCLGYKGEEIKKYFLFYPWVSSSFTLNPDGSKTLLPKISGPSLNTDARINFIDTGLDTPSGERLKRIEPLLKGERFFITYGDGLANLNLNALYNHHLKSGLICTLTGIYPNSPFGHLEANAGRVRRFEEKPLLTQLTNGGYYVADRRIFPFIAEGDNFESDLLSLLCERKQLAVYEHKGFWACMDTPKDVERLNNLWKEGKHPWKRG